MNLRGRRLLVPEVVQTSAMDCGPAALKCLVEGFGIAVNYGRLREACQTEVDGTSIDTLEEVAGQLGLSAEQIMVPADFVLLGEAELLPCIAVVVHPNGVTHFVVVWRKFGRWLQIMDPGVGRQWISSAEFLSKLYLHVSPVPASGWHEWARSERFSKPIKGKLEKLGLPQHAAGLLVSDAMKDSSWRSLARLDAGTRATGAMVRSGVLRNGREAQRVLQRLLERACRDNHAGQKAIPADYWSVWEAPTEGGEERVFFRGAVLVHVSGAARARLSGAGTGRTFWGYFRGTLGEVSAAGSGTAAHAAQGWLACSGDFVGRAGLGGPWRDDASGALAQSAGDAFGIWPLRAAAGGHGGVAAFCPGGDGGGIADKHRVAAHGQTPGSPLSRGVSRKNTQARRSLFSQPADVGHGGAQP